MGEGLCCSTTNFPELLGAPAALPSSELPKPSLGDWGEGEHLGRRERRGLSARDAGHPGPLAAARTQRLRHLHVREKTREPRRGCPGRAPAGPWQSGGDLTALRAGRSCGVRARSLRGHKLPPAVARGAPGLAAKLQQMPGARLLVKERGAEPASILFHPVAQVLSG